MGLQVSALATHMSVFAESLALVNFALDQVLNMDCSGCCAKAVGLGGWCQRETRGTDPQTWIVPWLHQLVLHTSSRLNFCAHSSHSDSSSSITVSALDALDTSALKDFGHWDIHNLCPDAFWCDHFDPVVGVLLGVLLRTLLLDLLRHFLWDRRLCGSRLGPELFGLWDKLETDLVAKLRRCFVDCFNEPALLPCKCLSLVGGLQSLVKFLGYPRPLAFAALVYRGY